MKVLRLFRSIFTTTGHHKQSSQKKTCVLTLMIMATDWLQIDLNYKVSLTGAGYCWWLVVCNVLTNVQGHTKSPPEKYPRKKPNNMPPFCLRPSNLPQDGCHSTHDMIVALDTVSRSEAHLMTIWFWFRPCSACCFPRFLKGLYCTVHVHHVFNESKWVNICAPHSRRAL